MRFATGRENIIRTADLTATNVVASSTFELLSRVAAGGGTVDLTGNYTGAEDATVDIEILSTTINGAPQISQPQYSGVGNGQISEIAADSGIEAQEFVVTVTDLGTPTRAAFAPFQSGNLISRTTGPDGNDYTVRISQAGLTATATDYAVTEALAVGAEEFTGEQYNFGAVQIEPEGTVPPDAPRLRFGDDVTVYRHWREFRDSRYRYHFSPAIQRAVPIGTRVYAITEGRTVTIYDGATLAQTITGITTLYSLVSAIRDTSALLDYTGVIALDRRPGGMACDDLSVYTASYSAGSVRDGTQYVRQATVQLTVPSSAPTESLSIRCIAAPVPGAEIWAVSGTVSGELDNATTGEAYTDVYGFTIPVQLQTDEEPPGEKAAYLELLPRGPTETVPSLCVRNFRLGADAQSKTYTFEWRPRPAAACDCTSVSISGGPNDEFLGIGGSTDVASPLHPAIKSLMLDINQWHIGSLAANCFFTGIDSDPLFATTEGLPFTDRVLVVTDVTDVSNPTYESPPPDYIPGSYTGIVESCSVKAIFDEQDIIAFDWVAKFFREHLKLIHEGVGSPTTLSSTITDAFQAAFDVVVDLMNPLAVVQANGSRAWKNQIAYIMQYKVGGTESPEERALKYVAAAVASSRNLTRNLDPLISVCRSQIGNVYSVADLNYPFDSAGLTGNAVWQDIGGTHWFESQDGLLPIQATDGNIPYYHSARMVADENGIEIPTATREFGIGPAIGCISSMKVGDKLIVITNPYGNARATYQPGDTITHQIVRADPVQLGGGQDGDDTITFSVRGSVVGALDPYELVTTAPAPYSAGGLGFLITDGAIKFAPGDQWRFSAVGGEFRWNFNDAGWTTADIAATVALSNGISAVFRTGDTPCFVPGDTYAFAAIASNGVGRCRIPDDQALTWSTSLQLDIDPADSGAADTLLLATHTIPSSATITLVGSNDNFATNAVTQVVPWSASHIGLPLAAVATCSKWRLTVNAAGSIGWLYLGVPPRPRLKRTTLPRAGIWEQRIRLASAVRKRGLGGRISYTDCGYDSVMDLLDALEYAQTNDDSRVGIVSEEAEAGLCTVPAEVDLTDKHWHQPATAARSVSVALDLTPV